RQYGIHGFCYHHYWFHGRRILERPFDEVLASGQPDFPFCLSWANENWTRTWDGLDDQVLLAQTYSEEDDRAHIRWLCTAFRDERYIRVHGKPLFLVYRAASLPADRRWHSSEDELWFSYPEVVDAMLRRPLVSYPRFPGVSPGWDNTPRRGAGGAGIRDATPADYERWLRRVLDECTARETASDFI